MNFPEFTFIDQRLAKAGRGHSATGARGHFADPEARQLYDEIVEMTEGQGAKPSQANRLLGQLCKECLIEGSWATNPHFTIDQRLYDELLTPASKLGAEALYNALSAQAAEMVGKTVII